MNNGARWIFTSYNFVHNGLIRLNILLLLIIYAIGQIGISIYLHWTTASSRSECKRWAVAVAGVHFLNNYSLFKQELHGFYWSHLCFALAALALNNIIFYLCWERSSSNPIFIPSYVRWPLITTMVVFTLL
jgi:hypothetical protein